MHNIKKVALFIEGRLFTLGIVGRDSDLGAELLCRFEFCEEHFFLLVNLRWIVGWPNIHRHYKQCLLYIEICIIFRKRHCSSREDFSH